MKRRKLLKTCSLVAGMSLLFTSLIVSSTSIKAKSAAMRSATDIVKEMGVGWNLGNTLDAKMTTLSLYSPTAEYETGWGNPVTTKAMMDKIKEAGFKTIRIPITWGEHMDSNNKVTSAWMKRVKEVVNYAIDDGFYVIINVHHDGNWCVPDNAHQASVTPKLQALWKQIATEFKNYDDHLIFETLNEPRLEGTPYEWNGGTSESRNIVNKYNETALNSIRSTGGNNASRAVMMPTYAASTTQAALNDFKVPNDKNVIASIHAYSPYFFAMDITSNIRTWGSGSDKYSLDSES
jgi:endoglucanase